MRDVMRKINSVSAIPNAAGWAFVLWASFVFVFFFFPDAALVLLA